MMSGVQATVPSSATTASPATITSTKNNNNRNRNKKKAILYGFWRILFATVALLDLTSCWSTIILSGGAGAGGAGGAGLGRSGVERNLKEGVTKRQRRRKTDTVVYNNQINEEDETPVVEDNTCEKNDELSSISADDDDDDDDDTFNKASFLQQHQNVNGGKIETTSEIISEDSYYYYYYYYDYYDYYSTTIIESVTVLWSSFSNKLVGGVGGGEGNNNSALSNELNSFNGTCINKKSVSKKKKIKKNNNKKKRQEQEQQQQQQSSTSSSSYLFSPLFSIMIHLLLGLLCLIEMIIRSIEAKRIVFEHEAINLFEEKFAETIARVYSRRKLVLQGHRHNRLRQKHNIKFNLAGGGVSGFFMNATTKSNTAITRMIKTQRTSFKLNPYLPSFSSSSTDTTTTTATMTATTATPSMAVLESSDDDQQKLLLLLLEEENKDTDHAHHDIVNAIASNVDNDHAIPNDDDEHDHDDHDHDEHEYVNVNVEDDDEGFEEEEEEDEEQKVVDADVNKEDNEEDEAKNKRNIILFLRSTFRLYLPVGITCIFWISLLPFKDYYKHIMMFKNRNDPTIMINSIGGCINSDEDTALATIWITTFIKNWNETIIEIHDIIVSTAWEQIIWQYNAIFQPKLFWKRVQNVLNVVKWIRFAFPLFRMILKLNDQIMLISSTYRSMKSSDKQRERRIRRPSLMLRDLRRIESFHKVETTLASWPSQCSMLLDMAKETLGGGGDRGGGGGDGDGDDVSNNNNIAEQFLEKSRIRGKQITKTIKKLQRQLRRSVTEFTSSEVYDNIVRLSRDISCRHIIVDEDDVDNDNDHNPHEDDHPDNSNTRSSSNSPRSRRRHYHRSSDNSTSWYDYLHLGSLLGSRDYLISPRSRFSVMVRITVTNCLLLELTRLFVSWHLTQTFHLSITQVITRLFIDCDKMPEETKRHFKFVTDHIDNWHTALAHAVPFVPFPKEKLLILCVPTSQLSKLFLQLGFMLETFIDVVSFLDIFFWFFTGDLDGETGLVVPKAFFGRCILPGTLVQVLDHPTLPKVLPFYINRIVDTTISIGWSRVIRWILAIVPALTMIVFQPLAAYFFRHFEDSNATGDEDILMSYAESFGYLPQRVSMMAYPSNINMNTSVSRNHNILHQEGPVVNRKAANGDIHEEDIIEIEESRSPYHGAQATIADTRSPQLSPARMALRMGTLYTNDNKNNLDKYETVQIPHIDSMGFYNNDDILEEHPSTVRFANDVSVLYNHDNDNDDDPHNDSSMGFDIGLSLSSHALDDL